MRIAIITAVLCISAVGICVASNADAAMRKSTHIAAQGLGPALQSLAKERGFQVIYLSSAVETLQTPGVNGELTSDEALGVLLSGTGLTYRYLDENTVTIVPLLEMPRGTADGLGASAVSGAMTEAKQGPDSRPLHTGSFPPLRLAQNAVADSPTTGYPNDANSPKDAGVQTLQEVVVVARRRNENLQSVPLTVTAITANVLQANTIQTGTDLQGLVPTLSVTQNATSANVGYSLRGVRSGVLTYLGDVPVDPDASDLQLWDLSSVQALAGPQGTLFGRNSTGGAILFIPERPSKVFEGFAEITAGDYGLWQETGVLNLPASDTLQLRLGAQITRRDGVVENTLGSDLQSQHRNAFRLSVAWAPTDWLSNYTLFDYARRDELPFAAITRSLVLGPCNPAAGSLLTCPFVYGTLPAQQFELQQQLGIRKVAVPTPVFQQTRPWGVADVLSAHLGSYELKYIGSYRSDASDQLTNQTSLALPITVGENITSRNRTITQELQLFGKTLGDRLDWILGAFYLDNSVRSAAYYQLLGPVGAPFSPAAVQGSGGTTTLKSLAGYAQGTYALTDELKVTAGLRYTRDKPTTVAFSSSPTPGGTLCLLPPTAPGVDLVNCELPLQTTFHALTYNLSLDYQVLPQVLLYATTRRGYNTGGFNAAVPTAPTYQPEHITDYEIGSKSDWTLAGHPLRANVSAYVSKYSDIQRFTNFFAGNPPAAVVGTFNAAKATLYGAQIEFDLGLLRYLELSGSFAYLHTRYDSFENVLIGDETGNRFAQAPEHTAHFSLSYRHPVPLGGDLGGAVTYAFQGAETFVDANIGTPNAFQPGYGLLDLRLDWRNIANHGLDVGLFVKNLTNKVYAINILDETATPLGFASDTYGDPRTYGAQVRYQF